MGHGQAHVSSSDVQGRNIPVHSSAFERKVFDEVEFDVPGSAPVIFRESDTKYSFEEIRLTADHYYSA
jgi:hypothetical protein